MEDSLKVYYCKEAIVLDGKPLTYYAPMVSFCDIPLSEVKDHISKYGCYGIGMTKECGVRKGINPILYLSKTSSLSNNYSKALNHYYASDGKDLDDWSDEQKSLADILRYIKHYEADLIRKGEVTRNYRFSDEREWRYVPGISEDCNIILGAEWYEVPENKEQADTKLIDFRLNYEPCDINYIIINDDSEISEFIDHLRRATGQNHSYTTLKD